MAANNTIPPQLPPEVRDLALRLGARADSSLSSVSLAQVGTVRDKPKARPMRFRARQTISLISPEFIWRASTGPFGCVSVIDALKQEHANLEVRLFGRLRLASVTGGSAALKGELMRYLAELAWAPDAIFRNSALSWTAIDRQTFLVGAGRDHVRGQVELKLDADGRIASVFAPDRPRREGNRFVERPWGGRFFDYRTHLNRWLPFRGEVGWILDSGEFVAWRGELRSWTFA